MSKKTQKPETEVKEKAKEVTEVTEEAKSEAIEDPVEGKEEAPEPLMYVGPTVIGLGIQNRVYSEIPDGALELIKETPALRNLFIPIAEYPTANTMLRNSKGNIYSAFKMALKIKNGGNKS
jgi:hypothetical protein